MEGGGDLGNSHAGNLGIGLVEQKGVRKQPRGSVSRYDFGKSGAWPPSAQWPRPLGPEVSTGCLRSKQTWEEGSPDPSQL